MEIPYIVEPRKETGLFNSKIAIWLFLASEVMLFGGFFSAYIFLRLGADYPWPERTLPVLPGLINTFILIGSSVTVVFAWAALKLREWRKFQVYMSITVFCAVLFMAFKGVEYYVKLHHQAVRLNDYSVIEGHLGYEKEDKETYAKNHKGQKIEENMIRIASDAGDTFTFASARFHAPWVEMIIAQAEKSGAKFQLVEDIKVGLETSENAEVLFKKGTLLSVDLLKSVKSEYKKARANNANLKTEGLREAWLQVHDENPGKKDYEVKDQIKVDTAKFADQLMVENGSLAFELNKPAKFRFRPRDVQEGAEQSKLRDDTAIRGKMEASPMIFHHIDAIDFQHLVMIAEQKGIEPDIAIANSWLMKNDPFVREIWAWHQVKVAKLEAKLIKKSGLDEDGNAKRFPTHKERYRIGWKEMAEYGQEQHKMEISSMEKLREEFMGPNYKARGDETFPELSIPREEIRFASKFAPAWNTYYAIYFTMTGLHGLHVVGGALVLAYYLFFGRKMYLENPEWLANRVEVGGLFWHFVDLVWIFVFPILYLM